MNKSSSFLFFSFFFLLYLSSCTSEETVPSKDKSQFDESVERAKSFLRNQLSKDQIFLSCYSNECSGCPLHKKGHTFSSFFILSSIGEELTPQEKNKILFRIYNETQNGLWGYTPHDLDSDDTAFALQSLIMLNQSINISHLLIFYTEYGFSTFLNNYSDKLVFNVTNSNNDQIHPEVNANIYNLLINSSYSYLINYDLIKKSQSLQGFWHSYFYPSRYYSTYLNLKILCENNLMIPEIENATKFIKSNQNVDGSWGRPGNAYDTALALNSLATCNVFQENFKKGITYLINNQSDDGSWKTSRAIWEYLVSEEENLTWSAYDVNNIITTSLSLQSLTHRYDFSLNTYKTT